jgi:hypothetical protein
MAIGQAAGTAAGLSALQSEQPRDLSINGLQEQLRADGASLRHDPEKVTLQESQAQAAIRKALADGRITGLHMARRDDIVVNAVAPRL